MKELRLFKTPDGSLIDGEGNLYWIPQKEAFAPQTPDWKGDGGLDISGSVTVTGNLVVQQSQHVYLRGPVTSSAILVNGPLTASSLWIRDRSGDALTPQEDYGSVRVDGDIQLSGKSINELISEVKELKERIKKLENQK